MKVIGVKYIPSATPDKAGDTTAVVPYVYLMSDSSLLKDGKPFFVPDFANEFVGSPSIVIRICRLGKNIAAKFANRYYDALTVGLALTAKGMSGSIAGDGGALTNAFDGAAILGDFVPKENVAQPFELSVSVDEKEKAKHTYDEEINRIDKLIEYISRYFTLKIGDIIYADIDEQSAFPMKIDTHVSARLNGSEVLHFKVK